MRRERHGIEAPSRYPRAHGVAVPRRLITLDKKAGCYYNCAMEARTAALRGTPVWSNGDLFDGYVLIGIVTPAGYDYAAPISMSPGARLPVFTVVPITAGVFNAAVRLYFSADLEPPNCGYVAYWYDLQDTLLSGPSAPFTIASDTYAIALPILTAPAAGLVVPTPATTDPTPAPLPASGYIDETPAGVLDSSNTIFTLSHTPSTAWPVLFYWNGLQQTPDGFGRNGSTIAMVLAPDAGDILRAVYWL